MDYFIADLHLSHRNILKYALRPFSDVNEMNEHIVSRWNERVHSDDTVYVVGDVFFCSKESASAFMCCLKGTKILLRGNHDKWTDGRYQDVGFSQIYRNGLDYTLPDGRKALVSHYPRPDALLEKYDVQIHGHSHSTVQSEGKRINVSCEAWDYLPASVDDITGLVISPDEDKFCEICVDNTAKTLEIKAKINLQNLDGVIREIYQRSRR